MEELTSSEIADVFQVHDKSYNTVKDRDEITNIVNTYTFDALVKLFAQTRLFYWLISNKAFHRQSQYVKYLTFNKKKSNFVLQEEEHPLGAEFGVKRCIAVSLHQLPGPRHL